MSRKIDWKNKFNSLGGIIMLAITLVPGGISVDYRGKISHVNDLDMAEIRRFYVIHQHDTSIIRAWHGHQYERTWFYCVKGAFTLAFVKVDNWESPSPDLQAEIYHLSADVSQVLCIPAGYANGIRADEPDSELLVFSDKILSVAVNDSWRYDKGMWVDWEHV